MFLSVLLAACKDESTKIRFLDSSGRQLHAVAAEVMDTEQERAKGLMFRKELPEDRGMLFIFEDETVQNFWMKNTFLPLDMIFVSADKAVVGVVEKAAPLTETPRGVGKPSLYVIELIGGSAGKFGIIAGTKVEF